MIDDVAKRKILEIGKTYEANSNGRGDYPMGDARIDMADILGANRWAALTTQQRNAVTQLFEEGRAIERKHWEAV